MEKQQLQNHYDLIPCFDYHVVITWMQDNKCDVDKMKKYGNIIWKSEQLLGFQILPFFSEETSLILPLRGPMYSEKSRSKIWKIYYKSYAVISTSETYILQTNH